MNTIALPGLTPIPLGNYLAALGLLKAISQKWPEARGYWKDDIYHLRGRFGENDKVAKDNIIKFLAEKWEPTPFIRPWNPDENEDKKTFNCIPSIFKTTRDGLQFSIDQIPQSKKLKSARKKLKERKDILNTKGGSRKEKQTRIKEDQKIFALERVIMEINMTFSPRLHRDISPESTVSVIDATLQTLTEAKQDRIYAPILGTGGNDGKRDFMRVWMIQIQEIYSPSQIERSKNWLAQTLGLPTNNAHPLSKVSGNSWFPDAVKIHNSGQQGFFTEHPSNPWLYVLACEGVCILSGSSSRRLGGHAQASAIFPFVTNPESPRDKKTAGHVSAEFWAPIWHKPATHVEITGIFRHGRASFSGRAATHPHRLAEAIMAQGTERGVIAFERHELSQTTSSNTFEALPKGRFNLHNELSWSSICLTELTIWENKLPRDSVKIVLGLRRAFEDAILSVSANPDDYNSWQHLLITCAEIDRRVDCSKELRKSCRPVPPLSLRWRQLLDDGSEEFELAAAVASLRGNRKQSNAEGCGPFRENIFSVELFECAQFEIGQTDDSWTSFRKNPSSQVVWSGANLLQDMSEVLHRRCVDSPLNLPLALHGRITCSPSILALFLNDQLDCGKIARLIPALSLLNWNDHRTASITVMTNRREQADWSADKNALRLLPRSYLLLKLLFQPFNFTRGEEMQRKVFGGKRKFPPRAPLAFAALAAGDLNRAVEEASTRLRACGLSPVKMELSRQSTEFCQRLMAALLVPIHKAHLRDAVQLITEPKRKEE